MSLYSPDIIYFDVVPPVQFSGSAAVREDFLWVWLLWRQHGLAAAHLYGLEVVVVDADDTARKEVATREPSDPNRDLWWTHTGAGGGNFGIVTRCGFRSPGVTGNDPALLLPRAPESILVFRLGLCLAVTGVYLIVTR